MAALLRIALTVTGALLIVGTAGCAASGTPVGPAPAPTPETCTSAGAHVLDSIAEGFDSDGMTLGGSSYTVATEREQMWFVAAHIVGPGIEDGKAPGLWAVTIDPAAEGATGASILSANAYADQYTAWPDGAKTRFGITEFEGGGEEALACIGG